VASTPRPFSAHEWQIAWRYLRARRQHGGISVIAWYALIGVMLGVATLIVVQAVMIGFREEFTDRILGANAHMTVYNQNYQDENGAITRAITDYAQVVETVRTVDGVTHVSPMVRGQVMGSANGRNVGVDLRGQAPEDIAKLPLIGTPEAAFGELSDLPNGIAIGEGVARELRIGVGDTMTIISPNGVQTAFGATMPRLNDYEVVYVFKVGRYDIDQTRVYLPLAEAQYYFDREGSVDEIEVLVENALDVERRVMFIILSLVVLIAALNIISGLVMLVKNKGRDIGILRTMGLTQGAIMRVFFICGSAIGVIGTLLGVILGCLFAYYIQDIQQLIEGIFGGQVWDPQVRLLKLNPVEALRYE